ncbi:30S ribosomal protein S16 [Stratiformator vulcanicus]|uniref:Small ribosomal subunit protein bS16 n=1 Tax=Stratiformator vulcanicus TaxID=2527980 RepID=A0A517R0C9_9PLAN|nr:30S ribosomal protein S16 [Stratiformator vulcanicus]QDT37356.1 30S ribosomal protein S16 [Stratiformator vulcanicus]
MAVRIRMKRLGRTHRPYYRICIMDSRQKRNGQAIEEVGHYDPMVRDKSARVTLDMERIDHWMSRGALPTEKVAVLIKKVRTNKFGSVKTPPPLTPQKEPEKPAEEAAESGEGETAEATAEGESEGGES